MCVMIPAGNAGGFRQNPEHHCIYRVVPGGGRTKGEVSGLAQGHRRS